MLYLVTMELIGPAPQHSPEELAEHLEKKIIPAHEEYLKLEAEGKILAGGDMTGQRGNVMIIDVESNQELSKLLMALPGWAAMKTAVTPLESFKDRQARHREMLQSLKQF